jgi:small subunit ribosomal protein S6
LPFWPLWGKKGVRKGIWYLVFCGESLTFAALSQKSVLCTGKRGDGILFFNLNNGDMQNYELMVIFTPVLSEEEFKASQKKYASLVKENGGEIVHENPWGLKSLAYPIQKKTTGLYWVFEYSASTDFNEKLKIQLLRDEQVLRHMITRLDKYAVEYNGRKRSGVPSGTEKVEG